MTVPAATTAAATTLEVWAAVLVARRGSTGGGAGCGGDRDDSGRADLHGDGSVCTAAETAAPEATTAGRRRQQTMDSRSHTCMRRQCWTTCCFYGATRWRRPDRATRRERREDVRCVRSSGWPCPVCCVRVGPECLAARSRDARAIPTLRGVATLVTALAETGL